MPYGVLWFDQHWFMEWLVASQHHGITQTDVDKSPVRSCGIDMTAILQEILKICVHDMSSEIDIYDDVIKWKHFPRYWPSARGIHRWPVNSPHKDHWHGTLMFSLSCTWINDWVNNGEVGDLRRRRAHNDVTVMLQSCLPGAKAWLTV